MHLRTNIFLWVSLATVIPLTAIVLIVTSYSEHLHRVDVDQRVASNLNFVVAEFDRRLSYEREVISALAASPSVGRVEPILYAAMEGRRHPDFRAATENLSGFLGEFQLVLKDVGTIRLMDYRGNSLVKVRFGERIAASFTGLDPYP